MKIVHICLAGSYNDDWTYHDNLLSQYHKELGHDVTLITSPFINDTVTDGYLFYKTGVYYNQYGIKIIRLSLKFSNSSKVIKKLRMYKGLFKRLEQEKPEIIFVHCGQFIDLNKIKKYKKMHPEIKLYIDNHADFSNSAKTWLSYFILHKLIWRKVIRSTIPYVRMYYGVLPARVDFLTDMYDLPSEKVELLVMGADDKLVEYSKREDVIADTRNRYDILADDFLVVTGGKIDKAKIQVLDLINAIKKIEDRKIKLIVFGPIVDELKETMLKDVDGKKIQYVGWLGPKESYCLFGIASLAVFPGRHSVYWEQAVGQGVPIMVKRWEGTTHIDVGGNCIFLEDGSEKEIKKNIVELFHNKQRYDNMRRAAESKGTEIFSYNNIARKSIEQNDIIK